MRDGNSETETELQAAERRISKIQPCGAARVANMEQSFLGLLEAIGEDPQREGLVRTPGRAARAVEFLAVGYRQGLGGRHDTGDVVCVERDSDIVNNMT